MDVLLQRHCAKHIYAIPEGLRELMSDISREVLRSQPEEIYTFIADYLDALLITRENARVAARLVESLTEMGTTIVDLLIKTGMTRRRADNAATVIQAAFRNNLANKIAAVRQQQQQVSEAVQEANIITEIIDEAGIIPEQAEQAAFIIQNAYRNFKHRQERETDLLKGMVDWRVAARSTMRLYRKTGVTYEEANRAATLIKAAYKGYYTRRIMKRLLEESECASVEESRSVEEEGSGKGEYTPHLHHFGDEAEEAEMYQDIEEVKREDAEAPPEAEEDTETMVFHIVDNLLKRVVLGSSSEIESKVKTKPVKDETPAETAAASPETVETSVQDASPEEGAGEASVTVATETPAEEEAPESEGAEAPATEVIMSPETDADEEETDTELTDTSASDMETETDATTTEEA